MLVYVYNVWCCNLEAFRAACEKRATLGLRILSEGEPYTVRDDRRRVIGSAVSVEVGVPETHFAFVAKLEALGDDEYMVSESPLAPVGLSRDIALFRGAHECAQCRSVRDRRVLYVVADLRDGTQKVVGSSCLAAHTGMAQAAKDALRLFHLTESEINGSAPAEGVVYSGGGSPAPSGLASWLPWCALSVRLYGFRPSSFERSSSQTAFDLHDLARKKPDAVRPEECDHTHAEAAAEWALGYKGDDLFSHKLRQMAKFDVLGGLGLGMACALLNTYDRHLGKERLKKERAEAKPAGYVDGELKTRVNLGVCTLVFVTSYDTEYGTTTVCKFRDAAGRVVVWKASSKAPQKADVGKRYAVVGRLEERADYKGEQQSRISRAKLEEVRDEEKAAS